MRNLISVAILAPAILLVGCSDSSNFYPPQGNNNTAKGKVYDGYLTGAQVCVDENINRACDAGEPSVVTDLNGDFTFTGLTDRQAAQPLVVQVIAGTLDKDTGVAPPADLKFIAPAGSTVISAFSTIIQFKIEAEIEAELAAGGPPKTLAQLKADATAALATELGVTSMDLTTYDPIKAKNNTGLNAVDRERAAKLHIANQILSEQIATLLPQAEANASPANDAAAMSAVIGSLDAADVLTAVNTDLAGMSLAALITLASTPGGTAAVTTYTALTVPDNTVIQDYDAAQQAAILAAFNSRLPAAPATGGTGTGGGGG